MNVKKNALLVAMGLIMACSAAATGASAETRWDEHHPRQHQVLARVAHQEHRIAVERRDGRIGPVRAHRLHAADTRILRQERREARLNGDRLTKAQHRQLNREENRVSRRIGA